MAALAAIFIIVNILVLELEQANNLPCYCVLVFFISP